MRSSTFFLSCRALSSPRVALGVPYCPSSQSSGCPLPAARATAAVQAGSCTEVTITPGDEYPSAARVSVVDCESGSPPQAPITIASSTALFPVTLPFHSPTESLRIISAGRKRRRNIGVRKSSSINTGHRPSSDHFDSSSR